MATVTAQHPAVAAAVRAHALVTDALGDTVSVDFGPVLGPTDSLESVAVGFSTEDAGAVTGTTEAGGLAAQFDSWEIGCMAQVVSGDTSIEAVQATLARAYELMDHVGGVLLAAEQVPGTTWEGVVRHQAQWIVTDSKPPLPGALVIFYVAGNSARDMTTR